jgi:peptidoglycan/LPS O-acetylase OafA/YrhL
MRKLSALTGIRAFAAFWVVLFHLRYLFSFGAFNFIIDKGYLGVDFFFVLSGFIMTYVHERDFSHWPIVKADVKTYFRFIALRWARMLPVHYATLLIILLMTFLRAFVVHCSFWSAHVTPGNFKDLLLHVLNLQGWGLADYNSWNIPAWSISSEWFAYLLFPAVSFLLLRRFNSVAAPLLLITLCFWGLSSFVAVMHLPSIDWTVHYSLIRVALEFLMGCGLCVLFKKLSNKAPWAGYTSMFAVLLILGTFGLHGSDTVALFGLTALVLSLAYSEHFLSKFFSLPPMLYLGEISYSTYMMYAPLMLLFNSLEFHFHWTKKVASPILFSALVGTQLILASCMYFIVEKPARDFVRKYLIDRYLKVSNSQATLLPIAEAQDEALIVESTDISPIEKAKSLDLEFSSWKPFSEEALEYQPIRRVLFRSKK